MTRTPTATAAKPAARSTRATTNTQTTTFATSARDGSSSVSTLRVSASPAPTRPPYAASLRNSAFLTYAALAGVCGALSGVCGKVAASAAATFVAQLLVVVGGAAGASITSSSSVMSDAALLATVEACVRVIMMCANAYFTGQMWRYYLRALSLGSTPVAQVVNTAANFAVSALVGAVVFGEAVGPMWFAGAAVAGCGLFLLLE